MSDESTPNPGGQAARSGFSYQDTIAASFLYELLLGAADKRAVTIESSHVVDDILVERGRNPSRHYQVKRSTDRKWSPRRLLSSGILDAFAKQLEQAAPDCELVLATPLVPGPVAELAELARRFPKTEEFREQLTGLNSRSKTFRVLEDHLQSFRATHRFLSAYYEETWPLDAIDIRDAAFGRHAPSLYDEEKERVWAFLLEYAGQKALRGKQILRASLLADLDDRHPGIHGRSRGAVDIRTIRLTAQPSWYVNRHEEWEFLTAYRSFLSGEPRNVVIMGDGGTGKSSFFDWIRRYVSKENRAKILPISATGQDASELLRGVNSALARELRSEVTRQASVSPLETLEWLSGEAQKRGDRVVIAIDHIESLFSSIFLAESMNKITQARFSIFQALRRTMFSRSIMWVMLARSEHFFLMFPRDRDVQNFNFSWFELSDFDLGQAEELVRRLQKISGLNLSSEAEALFIKRTGLHPQKLILSFLALVAAATAGKVSADQLLGMQPWRQVFLGDLESLSEEQAAVVYALATSLAMGPGRLVTFNDIHRRLSLGKRETQDILHQLQETYYLVRQPRRGYYALYHDDFAQFVVAQLGSGGPSEPREDLREHPYESRRRAAEVAKEGQAQRMLEVLLHENKNSVGQALAVAGHLRRELQRKEESRGKRQARRLSDLVEELNSSLDDMRIRLRGVDWVLNPDTHRQVVERVRLASVVQRAARSVQLRAATQRTSISIDHSVDGATAETDEGLLTSVVRELLVNAIKHSARSGRIRIRSYKDQDFVHLVVENDSAAQISSEEVKHLFDMGFRGKSAFPRGAVGAGVGLYTAKAIIEGLGSSIHVSSEPRGPRSLFRVTLLFPRRAGN